MMAKHMTTYCIRHYREGEKNSQILPGLLLQFLSHTDNGREWREDFAFITQDDTILQMKTPLILSARFGFVALTKMFLEMYNDADNRCPEGTLMEAAAKYSHTNDND